MDKPYAVEQGAYDAAPFPDTRRVGLSAPFGWLKRGASDFAAAPVLSMGYGLAFATLSLGLSYAALQQPQLALTFLAMLLVAGPVMATSLYHVPRLMRQGGDPTAEGSLAALLRCKGGIAVFVLFMLLITIAWVRVSSLMIALYVGQLPPGAEVLINSVNSADGLQLLGMLFANISLFALILFAASALSLPMIVDGKAEMIPALATSLKTVAGQPGAMLLWAGLIATLTLVGMATLFIGLIVVFPVLAYATWHSYKDLVE